MPDDYPLHEEQAPEEDELDRFIAENGGPPDPIVLLQQLQRSVEELLNTPEGRVRVANAGCGVANLAHKRCLENRAMGNLPHIINLMEMVEARVTGDEDWSGSHFAARSGFDDLLAGLR